MSAEEKSLDSLQAFMEKHQAKDYREATRLFYATPVLPEIARVLGQFAHVLNVLVLVSSAKETANLTRNLAVTLYLVGYRAGKAEGNGTV